MASAEKQSPAQEVPNAETARNWREDQALQEGMPASCIVALYMDNMSEMYILLIFGQDNETVSHSGLREIIVWDVIMVVTGFGFTLPFCRRFFPDDLKGGAGISMRAHVANLALSYTIFRLLAFQWRKWKVSRSSRLTHDMEREGSLPSESCS